MKIEIHNYLSGSYLLEQQPAAWDAIVILDSSLSHSDFVEKHTRRHLYLRFDDVESESAGKRAPVAEDVRIALEFAAESENLIVCCRAGQSRSAAIAYVICDQYLGQEAALQLLNPRRHIPNQRIVDLGDRLLPERELGASFGRWKAVNKRTRLSDSYDEIEREYDRLEQVGARNLIVAIR